MSIKAAFKFIMPLAILMYGCGQMSEEPPQQSILSLSVMNNELMATESFVINLSCDNVFGTGASADWTQSNVTATNTVSIISGKACTVQVASYNDGINTYTPVSLPLNISVSSLGSVSQASPVQYTSQGTSPILQWFSAQQNTASYSVLINYAAHLIINSSVTQNNISDTIINLSIDTIPAPTISGLKLSITNAAGVFSYTLTATASGSTGCKYIDNSSSTYSATSWSSVNTAYNAAGAIACPVFTPASATTGNWNSRWQTGKITLVMWSNNIGGVNSYTTANFGP